MASTQSSDSSLVDVSYLRLLVAASPMVVIAVLSNIMGLNLESPIVVGCLRCFLQLSCLGFVLQPIFVIGEEHWWVVLVYVLLMIAVTATESASRPAYQFPGMFGCVLISLFLNVFAVLFFTFGLIIRPEPVFWEPQYVIPISGMVLGNCINGLSLSLNNMLTGLVENRDEVNLLLAFGASAAEATSRILREALRTGTMPMLNAMSIVGLVSIPGMMTGQILGGSPAMEAARYQMLIIYLITIATFGSMLTVSLLSLEIVIDASTDTFHAEGLTKREEKPSFLEMFTQCGSSICRWCRIKSRLKSPPNSEAQPLTDSIDSTLWVTPGDQIQIRTLLPSYQQICLKVCNVNLTIRDDRRLLFRNVSFTVAKGEILLVGGPSGCGKTQLLRVIAGLVPMNSESGGIVLESPDLTVKDMALWRQQVRYVSQKTISFPGTVRDFLDRVVSFRSRRRVSEPVSSHEMMASCRAFILSWKMDESALDKNWSALSGGEGQRIILAIALASRPRVLLLDECTSALDLATKVVVEQSVVAFARASGTCVLWVTHDVEQMKRMSQSQSITN